MTRQKVIEKANELEETLRQALPISEEFYRELLDDYFIQVGALKVAGDSYPWEKAIEIQEKHSGIGDRMPNITEEEFDEYVVLSDQLAILYSEVPSQAVSRRITGY